MEKYDNHTVKISRTFSNDSHPSRQPSVESIIKGYCSGSALQMQTGSTQPVQRVTKEGARIDLNEIPFPVLAWLEAQCIRINENGLLVPREERFGDIPYLIENNADKIEIHAAYERRKGAGDAVLYEGMREEKGPDAKMVYPGLDSCIGITVTNSLNHAKIGSHFVSPFERRAFETYCSNLDSIYQYYRSVGDDFCRVAVSSLTGTRITDHIWHFQGILDNEPLFEVEDGEVKTVIGQLTELSRASFIISDESLGDTGEDVTAAYGSQRVHVVKANGVPEGVPERRVSSGRILGTQGVLQVIPDTYRAVREIAEDTGMERERIQFVLIPAFEQHLPYRSAEHLQSVFESVEGVSKRLAADLTEYIFEHYRS